MYNKVMFYLCSGVINYINAYFTINNVHSFLNKLNSCGVGGSILQLYITDWHCVVGSPTFADIL